MHTCTYIHIHGMCYFAHEHYTKYMATVCQVPQTRATRTNTNLDVAYSQSLELPVRMSVHHELHYVLLSRVQH